MACLRVHAPRPSHPQPSGTPPVVAPPLALHRVGLPVLLVSRGGLHTKHIPLALAIPERIGLVMKNFRQARLTLVPGSKGLATTTRIIFGSHHSHRNRLLLILVMITRAIMIENDLMCQSRRRGHVRVHMLVRVSVNPTQHQPGPVCLRLPRPPAEPIRPLVDNAIQVARARISTSEPTLKRGGPRKRNRLGGMKKQLRK